MANATTASQSDASPKKKYLDKFASEDELVKAYTELEQRLGKQSAEVGDLRKQYEQAVQAMQQYAEAVSQLRPYADWFAQNQQALQLYTQWMQQHQQSGQASPNGQRQQAVLDLLTPDERQALLAEATKTFEEKALRPYMDQLNQQLHKMAEERERRVLDQIGQQQRAFTEVLWRTWQRVLPEDKVREMREWHEQALAMADPQKFDPMKAADEFLSHKQKVSTLEEQLKALEAEREKWQKDQTASLAGSPSPVDWAAPADDAPKTADERRQRVLRETQEAVGREAFRDFFTGVR